MWGQFQGGPEAVVNALPKRSAILHKFPGDGFLAAFFNTYAAEYPWRNKRKMGLECLNRVMRLAMKEHLRQQGRGQRDPNSDIRPLLVIHSFRKWSPMWHGFMNCLRYITRFHATITTTVEASPQPQLPQQVDLEECSNSC